MQLSEMPSLPASQWGQVCPIVLQTLPRLAGLASRKPKGLAGVHLVTLSRAQNLLDR